MRSRTSSPSVDATAPQATQAWSRAWARAMPALEPAALRPPHQLARGGLPARAQAAEVEAGRAGTGVPRHGVLAGRPRLVEQRGHAAAMDIVDPEYDAPARRQREMDRRAR